MNLCEEVRALSKRLNVSLTELARRTGQSTANLSKKLNKGTLSFEDFEKILSALGVRMETGFLLPGEQPVAPVGTDRRTEGRIAILEKELELERLKNDYYEASGFQLRTAMETISGSIDLISRHADDPQRVKSCVSRMQVAMGQLENIVGSSPTAGKPAEPVAATMAIPLSGLELGGKRVLVVDDNAINRDIVSDLLSDSGLAAEQASDGEEAVERISGSPPGYYDLVLMDLHMPRMDGFTAAEQIRHLPDGRASVRVVAMTAGNGTEDRDRASSAGMDGFIQKPLNLAKLLTLMTA